MNEMNGNSLLKKKDDLEFLKKTFKKLMENFLFNKPMIVGRSSGLFLNVLFTRSCASSLNVVGNSYFSCVTLLNVP
jgi:hypothetical protein